MTVCAYDGKSIATDRQMTSDSTIEGYQKKLMTWSGGVWTSAGRLTDHVKFQKWLENRDLRFRPHAGFNGFFTEKGVVYEVDRDLEPYEALPRTALGDGGRAATVLMQAGFTAKQAVKEVCKHNVYCGGKVDSVDV